MTAKSQIYYGKRVDTTSKAGKLFKNEVFFFHWHGNSVRIIQSFG